MEDEHLSTFSNEEIVPIPRESEETSRSDSKNVLPSYDDFSSINVPRDDSVTFSNPLFEFDVNFNSSDINPLFDEVLEDIECKDSYDSNLDKSNFLVTPLSDFNKDECLTPRDDIEFLFHHDPSKNIASILEGFIDDPLFEDNDDLFDLECKTNDWKGILYDALIDKAECFDPGGDNNEIDVFLAIEVPTYIEGYFDSEGDSDPLHHEFTGEHITIPPRIDREHEDYINEMSLLCGNSSSRSLENFQTIIESLPTSTTLIEDSDSNREEIDIFYGPDDSIPPGIESDFDSKEDIIDNLLNDNPIPEYERLTFDMEFDMPVINNVDELNEDECFDPSGGEINVEVDDSFTFVTRTFLLYLTYPEVSPLLSSTKNEDTIFDLGLTPKFSKDVLEVRFFVPVRIMQKSQENGQNRTNTGTGKEREYKSRENAIKAKALWVVHECIPKLKGNSRGAYHRDLKPENLLLDDEGNLKIFKRKFKELKAILSLRCGKLHVRLGNMSKGVFFSTGQNGSAADFMKDELLRAHWLILADVNTDSLVNKDASSNNETGSDVKSDEQPMLHNSETKTEASAETSFETTFIQSFLDTLTEHNPSISTSNRQLKDLHVKCRVFGLLCADVTMKFIMSLSSSLVVYHGKQIVQLKKSLVKAEKYAAEAQAALDGAESKLMLVDGEPVVGENPASLRRLKLDATKTKDEEYLLGSNQLFVLEALFLCLYKSFSNVLMERLHDTFGENSLEPVGDSEAMAVDEEDTHAMETDKENGGSERNAGTGYIIGEKEQWCLTTLGYVKAFSRQYASEMAKGTIDTATSVLTQRELDAFCKKWNIPASVEPELPGPMILLGIVWRSQAYDDEDVHPTILDSDNKEMGLFDFIKSSIRSRDAATGKGKKRVAFDSSQQPVKKSKTAPSMGPPLQKKKNPSTGGKTPAALQKLVSLGTLPEKIGSGSASAAMDAFVSESVTPSYWVKSVEIGDLVWKAGSDAQSCLGSVVVSELEAATTARFEELVGLGAKNTELIGQVFGLKTLRDELKSQINGGEEMGREFLEVQDAQAKRMEKQTTELDERLTALNTNVNGLRLAVMKFKESYECQSRLGKAISLAIKKGIQDGLKVRIEHGKAGRGLENNESYDAEVEAKYLVAVKDLEYVPFPLLEDLEARKDSIIELLMASLTLGGSRVPGSMVHEILLHDALAASRARGEMKKKKDASLDLARTVEALIVTSVVVTVGAVPVSSSAPETEVIVQESSIAVTDYQISDLNIAGDVTQNGNDMFDSSVLDIPKDNQASAPE
ncbi:nuclear cap-binding protein subunit 1 [Tanacetum coccineum]|uniref:Nuclear cap-binding protein subunit 1 n=1 Tax=Tanacetum coccineum TaxID=301880 RepID=A0ABQ5BDF8_9ASTR